MTTEPVALSQDLGTQRVMRAQVSGQDLAIWRSASSSVQAWGNRCPHRGMRLSYGFVRGESLACAYHGWHYNCAATCHYIPAHPELVPPDSIKPAVYSAVDQQAILWVSVDDAADPVSLPNDCVAVRSITLDCSEHSAVLAFTETPPPTESQTTLSASVFSEIPKIIAFGDSNSNATVFVLFQSPEPRTINAHVVATKNWTTNGRIGLSRWCESVRRFAERAVS